jgi:hypothetical protein
LTFQSEKRDRLQLPSDVSFEKQRLSNAWAYVFRHRLLGFIAADISSGVIHERAKRPAAARRSEVVNIIIYFLSSLQANTGAQPQHYRNKQRNRCNDRSSEVLPLASLELLNQLNRRSPHRLLNPLRYV